MSAWTFDGLTGDEIRGAVDFARERGWGNPAPDTWEALRASAMAGASSESIHGRAQALRECDAAQFFTRGHLLSLMTCAPEASWRFDVDISLAAAARMAEFAQIAGVRGVFYVMATGSEYNPFSPSSSHTLNTIRSRGHRLGLHVDANGTDPHRAIDQARRLTHAAYSDLFDLNLVSFHMPGPDVLWRDFAGVENAYAPKWEGRYLSDSRREWGPEKEALVSNDMQIALHPEHWVQ